MRRWLLGGLLVSGSAVAADWPQWLGPNRTGHAAEGGLVEAWGKGPKELWRVVVGPGYASVSIAEGVVYAMAARDGEDQLVALDAATGAERWRTKVGPFYKDAMNFDGPRATPSVVGDRVIAQGGLGHLVAVSRDTGAKLWEVDTVGSLGGVMPQWGYSGSPLVSEGKVYLSTGGQAGNALVALSLADGSVLWKTGAYGAGYASPVRVTVAGKDQVLFFTGYGAVATTPHEGEVIWRYPWTTNYQVNAATPLVVGGRRVFVASGYGVGAAMLEVKDDGKVSELWRTKKMKNKTSTSVLVGEHLFGFNESDLTALDVSTGAELWSTDVYGRGTLLAAESALVVLSEQCEVSLVKANGKAFEPVANPYKGLTHGPCWAAPSLANGVIYVRDGKDLVALEVRSYGPTATPAAVP